MLFSNLRVGDFGMLYWEVLVVDGVALTLQAKEHTPLYIFSIIATTRQADASVQILLLSQAFSDPAQRYSFRHPMVSGRPS